MLILLCFRIFIRPFQISLLNFFRKLSSVSNLTLWGYIFTIRSQVKPQDGCRFDTWKRHFSYRFMKNCTKSIPVSFCDSGNNLSPVSDVCADCDCDCIEKWCCWWRMCTTSTCVPSFARWCFVVLGTTILRPRLPLRKTKLQKCLSEDKSVEFWFNHHWGLWEGLSVSLEICALNWSSRNMKRLYDRSKKAHARIVQNV